jgi:hypothetical protein
MEMIVQARISPREDRNQHWSSLRRRTTGAGRSKRKQFHGSVQPRVKLAKQAPAYSGGCDAHSRAVRVGIQEARVAGRPARLSCLRRIVVVLRDVCGWLCCGIPGARAQLGSSMTAPSRQPKLPCGAHASGLGPASGPRNAGKPDLPRPGPARGCRAAEEPEVACRPKAGPFESQGWHRSSPRTMLRPLKMRGFHAQAPA